MSAKFFMVDGLVGCRAGLPARLPMEQARYRGTCLARGRTSRRRPPDRGRVT